MNNNYQPQNPFQNVNPNPDPNLQPQPQSKNIGEVQPFPPQYQTYQQTLQPSNVQAYSGNPVDPNSLIQDTENTKKLDIKKFIPFIIIGLIGIVVLIVVVNILFKNTSQQIDNQNNQKVVLQWWGVFMKPEEVQPLLDEYHNQHPNVTIEYANKWPDNTQSSQAAINYKAEIDRVLKANDSVQIPDIFMTQNTWAGDYERFVKPSTTYSAQNIADSFYPVISKDFAHGGSVYGVPLWLDTFAIVYNKDILASNAVLNIPADWPTFKSLTQNITKKSNNKIKTAGFAAGIASNTDYGFDLANILLFQNGATMTDSKDVVNFASNPDAVAALKFYKDFANGSTATWSSDFKNASSEFLQGNVAMIMVPSYRLREILHYNEQYSLNLDIGVAQIPQLTGQDQEVINWPDYWGAMVALNRPNSSVAWEFLNWITQKDQLKTLSNNIKEKEGYFGLLYPRKDMAEELSADTYLKIYNSSLPYLKTWYIVKGIDVKNAFNEVLNGSSISQGTITSLENTVKTLQSNKGKL